MDQLIEGEVKTKTMLDGHDAVSADGVKALEGGMGTAVLNSPCSDDVGSAQMLCQQVEVIRDDVKSAVEQGAVVDNDGGADVDMLLADEEGNDTKSEAVDKIGERSLGAFCSSRSDLFLCW
jgi:hypothetical protein